MTQIDTTTGRIFFDKCYYDVKTDDIVHDSGPFSDKTCRHNFGVSINIQQDELIKAREEFNIFTTECKRANDRIKDILNNPISFYYIEYVDISEYIKYWRLLEIPKSDRAEYNLLVSLSDNSVLLCTNKYAKQLIKDYDYMSKYTL